LVGLPVLKLNKLSAFAEVVVAITLLKIAEIRKLDFIAISSNRLTPIHLRLQIYSSAFGEGMTPF
jgi:hypothetical protein